MITILDIETIAQPEADIRAKLPPFDADKVPLGVLKDPDKILAKIMEAQANHGNAEVERAALSAETGIVAISGMMDDSAIHQFLHSEEEIIADTFDKMLQVFSGGGIISGWNVKGFDLPFLVKRAWLLNVKVPSRIFNPFKPRYPWSDSIVDLMDVWKAGQFTEKHTSLNTALRHLGLPQKTGSGADFGALWAGDKTAALAYNADDLELEMMVARRLV